MSIPFEASRLKIWRTTQHIASLEDETKSYMARNPAHINIRPSDPPKPTGTLLYEIVITEALPLHLSAIIGDIFHNLRTSLDLLASDLVRMNGQDASDVYFPFAESAAELEKMIKRRRIDRARPEVVDLVRSLKPYTGGNLALRSVHDLDIIDKHQALVPVFGSGQIPIENSRGSVRFDRADRSGTLKTGPLFRGHVKADGPIGEGLPFDFDLTLPLSGPPANEPVVPWCKSLVEEFAGVVDAFELLCFGTVTKQLPWA